MAVNVKALKDFQKVWGPVVESIPQVLDAVAVKGNLDNEIQRKQAELDQAKGQIAAVFDKANKELDALKAEAEKMRQERTDAQAEIAADKSEARRQIKAMKDKAEAALKAKEAKTQLVEQNLSTLEAEYAERKKAADAAHEVVVAAHKAEIADLEKTTASAQRTLDNLRKKLG